VAVPEESKDPNPVLPESPAPKSAAPSAPTESLEPAAAAPIAGAVSPPDAKPEAATAAKAASPAAATPTAPVAKPVPAKPEAPKPQPWDSGIIRKLKAHYGSGIKEASTYVGQKYLVLDSSLVYEVLLRMHDDELFDYCVDITAVHYPKREAQFDLLYILYSFHSNERIRVKTQIKDGERVQSVTAIWPTANWLEREVYDMFGIGFEGHPELKRILLPDGWKGHPLRKDYPILQQDQEWVKANVGIESGQ
jgi:NADH-quinone oxidoreductase subunit C